VKGGTIIISGQRQRQSEETEGNRFFQRERSFGRFSRVMPLPQDSDVDNIHAEYKKGVLNITIPKLKARKEKTAPLNKIQIL